MANLVNNILPKVILFPGQGAQFIGMCKTLLNMPKVNKMFEMASKMFNKDLADLCINGPKEDLDRTIYCQPIIFLSSLAAIEKLKDTNPEVIEYCTKTAGFSIGEYASLVFSGAITFENGMNRFRAQIMQDACNAVNSGLMSIFTTHKTELSLALRSSEEWCTKKLNLRVPVVAQIANYLAPDVKVIGANTEALEFIKLNYKEFEIARVKQLPVNGAFHTKLMSVNYKQIKHFKEIIKSTEINEPLIQVYSNITGRPYEHAYEIRFSLAEQFYKPVKWETIIHNIYDNDKNIETYECGPDKQLGVLLRLINKKAYETYKHIAV